MLFETPTKRELKQNVGEFLVVQWLGLLTSTAGVMGLIPGLGTKKSDGLNLLVLTLVLQRETDELVLKTLPQQRNIHVTLTDTSPRG